MSTQLFRQEALDAIDSSGDREFRLNPPAFVSHVSLFTICLVLASAVFIGNTGYARKHVVFGSFDEHHVAQIANRQLGEMVRLSVKEGDQVKKDQYLGSIRQTSKYNYDKLQAQTQIQIERLQQIAEDDDAQFKKSVAHLSSQHQRTGLQLKLSLADIKLQADKVSKLNQQVTQTSILHNKGYLSNLDWLNFQTSLITEQQQLNHQRQQAINLRHQLEEISSRIETAEHADKIRRAENDIQLSQLQALLLEHSDRNQQDLYAPQDGVITRIAFSPGETVFPGEIVLAVSEAQPQLTASLLIPSAAAGFINTGQELQLEVDAFPATQHGRIKATVVNVSDHIVNLKNQSSGYEAKLTIDAGTLKRTDHGRYLPGMNFKTFIRTEHKTLFHWLLAPLMRIPDLF